MCNKTIIIIIIIIIILCVVIQIQIQYKPIDALFRCKIDLYNRGYIKQIFFVP